MLKTIKDRWPLIALAGISTLSVGLVVALLKTTDAFNTHSANPNIVSEQSVKAVDDSRVLGLAKLPAEARNEALVAIAQQQKGTESDRARYLLATDLIKQGKGGSALPLLEGLDTRYDTLAPYALLKKGQAQAAAGQQQDAQTTWSALANTYPDSAATAEALYQLGKQDLPGAANNWNTLLITLPSHPRSIEVALTLLNKPAASANQQSSQPADLGDSVRLVVSNQGAIAQTPEEKTAPPTPSPPDELTLLKLIAYHGYNRPNDYAKSLNRLTADKYKGSLTPEDWEAIGFGYWETQNYGQAGEAYAKAPATPTSLYRAARGKERGGKRVEAIALYQTLNQTFPDTLETSDGLMNLALLLPDKAALTTLEQVMTRFPDKAAEALVRRADILEAMKSPDSAKQARASVLSQYTTSEAAAKIRLKNAKANAKKGDYAAAISWTQQLIDSAPRDELAAEAGFWLGKWQLKQNQVEQSRRSFEQVIRNHPEAYFAWRSAVYLNWDVGDFGSVRSLMPSIVIPPKRTPLPAGSATLQELYLLGQDADAWAQWQTEFDNPRQPTVGEQFTDGILRLGVGDNLNGIFMVSSLAWRELPDEKREYELLRETPEYWQAIYPFPFSDIIASWAGERQLNPLLVTGLVRQESRFQPKIESVVGAVGLMQVMPETAEWISGQIDTEAYSLTTPADNVKFGTWFLDFTHEQFDDNSLFAVASYNAGPAAVDEWIKEGGFSSADEFVEAIPYPETKGYISSVFGGYWNYLRLYNPDVAAKVAEL